MKCTVTGIETQTKYKGIPVCREILNMAKAHRDRHPGMSLRKAIVEVHATYDKVKAVNIRNESFASTEITIKE